MNQEESLSILTQKPSKNVKKSIIQLLATDFPLTAKQLHNKLQRQNGISVSYQAVHKVVKELEIEGVAKKIGKGWQLKNEWLHNQEKFIQQTKKKYSGKINHYSIDPSNPNPQTFEFDNFTSMCVETAKLVADQTLSKTNEKAYFVLEYGWWTLKFRFAHLKLLYKLVRNAPESVHLIQKVTPFGKWIQKQYERVGGIGTIGTDMKFDDDLLIQGDWIVQVHFTKKDKETIAKYWEKWHNLEGCFKEFGLKKEPKMDIVVTISKNSAMARFMKEKVNLHIGLVKK